MLNGNAAAFDLTSLMLGHQDDFNMKPDQHFSYRGQNGLNFLLNINWEMTSSLVCAGRPAVSL